MNEKTKRTIEDSDKKLIDKMIKSLKREDITRNFYNENGDKGEKLTDEQWEMIANGMTHEELVNIVKESALRGVIKGGVTSPKVLLEIFKDDSTIKRLRLDAYKPAIEACLRVLDREEKAKEAGEMEL